MHEPAVVLTDLALAILGAVLCWRLSGTGAFILGGLASAAFWGAIFHAFFPDRTSTALGFVAWLPVALSIMVVAAALLYMALSVFVTRPPRVVVGAYCAVFLGVLLLIDESFSTIVLLYGPVLVLALAAAAVQAIRMRERPWGIVALGLTVSAAAALLQQAHVAIHPVYFDHNAVYHVVQAVALVLLYLGFQRVGRADSPRRA
jgi:hypothetical protein